MVIRTLLSLLALLCCNTVAAQTFYVCEGPDTRTAQQIVFTDGSMPTAETERGGWFRNTGCPLDSNNRKVTTSCFLKER